MKVFAAVLLVVASVSAKGSGPYLPSGWRPQGPAFNLPSESKPSTESPKELGLKGSEASGSDFLREYGPPVSQHLISQGLPDVIVEQNFGLAQVEAKVADFQEIKQEDAIQETDIVSEANVEQSSEAATESAGTPSGLEGRFVVAEFVNGGEVLQSDAGVSSEGSTQSVISEIGEISQLGSEESLSTPSDVGVSQVVETVQFFKQFKPDVNQDVVSRSQEEQQVEVSQSQSNEAEAQNESSQSEHNAQNIPDIIASLEQEIKEQESAVSQAVNEVSSLRVDSEQAPEGFLEYGPPGFAEYGPPKGDVNEEIQPELQVIESNEARRRRFSPKFRPAKKL